MATDHNFKVKKGLDVLGGDVNLGDGFAYKIDGTTVVDSSRNLANIGTISSGNITSSGNVTISGNLTVNGTQTTLNTATLQVEDKNIVLNYGSGDTSSTANGAGITIQDAVAVNHDATILWDTSNDRFNFSDPINITSIGTNNTPSTDQLQLSGYGVIGNRGASVYVTNSNSSGTVQIGVGGAHNANPKLVVGSTSVTSNVPITSTGLTVNHSSNNGVSIAATDSTANQSFNASKIVLTSSGSDTLTGDRNHIGLFIDVNASATGGDTSNEHRVYGVFADVQSSGDSDLVYGVFGAARTNNFSSGTVTHVRGNFGQAQSHHNAGTVTNTAGGYNYALNQTDGTGQAPNIYGAYNQAYAGSTSSYTGSNYYGSWNITQISGAQTANINMATAVYGEVQLDNATVADHDVTIGSSFVFRARHDENDADDTYTVTNGYLFHGDYTGTRPTNAWGIYISSDVDNYFAGNVRTAANFKIANTTVIDSSRNLTNIGTISSGAITATAATATFGDSGTNGAINVRASSNVYLQQNGTTRATLNSAGITSFANIYTGSSASFRNYGGVWSATTGLTGNGFTFANSVDGTALTLSSTGNAVFSGTISSGAITSSGQVQGSRLKINVPDGGGSPALTAYMDIYGYEGRGAGIHIRDSANSASNPSDREWFIGSGYNQNGFNIGYSATGSQTSYSAQNKFSLDTSGNAVIAGTLSSGAITASSHINLTAGAVKLRNDVALDHDGSSLYIKAPSAIYFYPGNANQGNISTNGTLNLKAYQVNGTTVIDSSRNAYPYQVRASGGDSTPAGTQFSNVIKGQGTNRTIYFDGDSSTVSTWYGVGNNPYAAIDAIDGVLKLYVNNTSGVWGERIRITDSSITNYVNTTVVGTVVKVDSVSDARFEADGATNNWKYLRLSTNTSANWDIATKNNDLSGALQFRPAGGSTNRTYMDTSGNWVFNGRLTNIDTVEVQKVVLNFDTGGNMIFGHDGSYGTTGNGRYVTLGFGGTTNGTNRIFAHNGTSAGIYIAAATSRDINFRVSGSGNNAFRMAPTGEFQMGSGNTTVIDSSRNLTNIGTISSGAITSTGIVSGTAFVGGLYGGATGAPDARIWAVSADYPNYGIFYNEGNPDKIEFKWNNVVKAYLNMENGLFDSDTGFSVGGSTVINSSGQFTGGLNPSSLSIGGTTVIDSSRRFYISGGSIQHSSRISFLNGSNGTTGSGAQGIAVQSVYAGTNYSNTAPSGMVNALNGYQVGNTTVIDSSRNGNFSGLQGTRVGVNNTSATTKYGVALYGGYGGSTNPTYGMMFTGTSGSGTHGAVTGDWATYFTMNTSANRGWIFRTQGSGNVASISNTGNATFDGNIKGTTDSGIYTYHSNIGGFVLKPGGAQYTTNTSTVTGAIKIELPVYAGNDMISFWVDIYDYRQGTMTSYFIGGYIYQTEGNNEWVNESAICIAEESNTTTACKQVRFGVQSNKHCVWIGETSTTWSYPQVVVRDFQGGYATNIDQWADGWTISAVTSLGTVDHTRATSGPRIGNEAGDVSVRRDLYLEGNSSRSQIGMKAGGVTRGYFYANNANEVGILDAGGSWAIRHKNDQGTEFRSDGDGLRAAIGSDLVTGDYGSMTVYESKGGWIGYSLNGRSVLMHDNSNTTGIYNDVDNEWYARFVRNSSSYIYFNNSPVLETQSAGLIVNSASGETTSQIKMQTNGSNRGFVYANTSNNIGFLDSSGDWAIRHINHSGTEFRQNNVVTAAIGAGQVSGSFGSMVVKDTKSGWGGYSINNRVVFMHDHGSTSGIYNDVNNQWMIKTVNGGTTELYFNGGKKLETTTSGAVVTGNIAHDGLTMTSGTDIDQLYEVTDSLTLTTSYQDTSINGGELSTGTYIIQLYIAGDHSVGGSHYNEFYSGVISWYGGSTNSSEVDEIVLHRAGHAPNSSVIHLRTQRHPSGGDNLVLQIKGNYNMTAARNYVFKFRRMI